ncbi:MAG: ferrous iron transport protein B [Desulfobacteraceae bacterium]|nr:ferrous iron transport protein B [Desulfobacteraceae bacterium]
MTDITIALSGNPNAGKTSMFNNLTGARQKVGNWPGVTIEKKEGHFSYKKHNFNVVDLPGTYSLTPFSIEEIVTRDFIIDEKPDVVVSIVDSSNLERSLYLAMQVMETGQPMVLALNMTDVAEAKGIKINADKLSTLLDIPVVFTVGNKNQGTDLLIKTIISEAEAFSQGKTGRDVIYSKEVENCIALMINHLEQNTSLDNIFSFRWTAVKLLENDKIILKKFKDNQSVLDFSEQNRKRISDFYQEDPEIVLTEDRYGFIAGITQEVISLSRKKRVDVSKKIDLVLTNRLLGFPIFIFFIWAMFQLTFTLGAYPMEWIDSGVSAFSLLLENLMPDNFFKDLLIDGIIAGIGSVIVFLPNILILFFCIALFEDTGYMARSAFLMDRIMHMIGLHGKSFIPMLMGFGCSIPAIMATRTLESKKDRILTILIIPFMSCSAKLPVYIVLAGTFFAAKGGTVMFCLYLTGIILAIISGRIFKSSLLKGEDSPFVMELPPYRMPMIKSLTIHMWDRSKMFLKKMGGVILIGSIIIWTLSYFPKNIIYTIDYDNAIAQLKAEYSQKADYKERVGNSEFDEFKNAVANLQQQKEKERIEKTYIGQIGKAIEPVFRPIGIDWRASVAIVTGIVAKEVVISTMGVLYGVGNEQSEALSKALKKSNMTPLSALSMMLFVLLYLPCIAALFSIWREASAKWAFFNLFYTTTVAWCVSFLIYQSGKAFGFG